MGERGTPEEGISRDQRKFCPSYDRFVQECRCQGTPIHSAFCRCHGFRTRSGASRVLYSFFKVRVIRRLHHAPSFWFNHWILHEFLCTENDICSSLASHV